MSESNELKCPPIPPPLLPPPPPLPAPQHLSLESIKQSPQALNKNESIQMAENDLDLSLKIIFSHEINLRKVFFISNMYLEPQLQEGPKCGLVALSIATSTTGNFISVDDIFRTALSLGFTKQGEMFSADSLASLAEKCTGFRATVIGGNLYTHLNCIIKSLLRKCLILVPYDADFNHSPCCKRGFKAHWAVISGFVIIEENITENNEKDNHSVVLESSKCSALCDCIDNSADTDLPLIVSADRGRVLIAKRTDLNENESKNDFRGGKVYLIGRQGKSRHLGLWPFDDMADSNDNLVSLSAGRSSESYLLPKNGLVEGLKGKAIILEYPVVA